MSFKLSDPSLESSAEELIQCQPESSIPFLFRYPGSWKIVTSQTAEFTECRLDHQFQDRHGGSVLLQVFGKGHQLASYVRCYRSWLADAGVRVHGAPLLPQTAREGDLPRHYYAPRATSNGVDVAVGACVIEGAVAVGVVGLLGPSRESSEWSWAINKRAANIIANSLVFPNSI